MLRTFSLSLSLSTHISFLPFLSLHFSFFSLFPLDSRHNSRPQASRSYPPPLLKALMEKKQLDFNAPLLSVRRFLSAKASSHEDTKRTIENSAPNRWKSLPSNQTDLELSEVTKPVAVPFMWEQIPGRRKGGSDSEQPITREEPSNTPRLPPGRALSGELTQDRNQFRPHIEPSNSIENSGERKKDTDLESDQDDAYSDALDTLSPSESFSFNCSLTGLSGHDGLDLGPSRTFYADPQTRDFMMSRFLPAAKAMVLDTPLYVSRKPSVGPEQPRNLKKVVSGEMRPLLKQCRSDVIPHYEQYIEKQEIEDEDDTCDYSGYKPAKACGLLPRFCIKNSLGILNPVPGLKVRTQAVPGLKVRTQAVSGMKVVTQAPMSTATKVNRLTRKAYSGPLTQIVDKHEWDHVYKKTRDTGTQSRELCVVEKKVTRESIGLNYSGDLRRTDGLSPHRRSRGGGISPYRNGSPRSPFHEGARFLGVPKIVENVKADSFNLHKKERNDIRDVSLDPRYKQGRTGSVSPAVEKTLYIDSVNTVSISSEAKGLMGSFAKNFDTSVETRGIIETIKALSIEADQPSVPEISDLKSQTDIIEGLSLDQGSNHESGSSEILKGPTSGSLISKDENTLNTVGQENADDGSLQSPVPPPLPKSPSESWLWRAVPSISARNSFSGSNFGSRFNLKKKGSEAPSSGTKWETIVKTSKLHHDHVRYSEELIPHVSQHSKT